VPLHTPDSNIRPVHVVQMPPTSMFCGFRHAPGQAMGWHSPHMVAQAFVIVRTLLSDALRIESHCGLHDPGLPEQ